VRVADSRAPVAFGPYYNPSMFTDRRQPGRLLVGINAATNVTSAGPSFTPSARNATTLTVADTVNWLKATHSIALGGEFGQYDVWLDTYGSNAVPGIGFGTQTGDPALGMFTSANFPGSSSTDRNAAAALYAVLTGRVTQYHCNLAPRPEHRQPCIMRQLGGRPTAVFDMFVQDN
jgi:hypothetical protein